MRDLPRTRQRARRGWGRPHRGRHAELRRRHAARGQERRLSRVPHGGPRGRGGRQHPRGPEAGVPELPPDPRRQRQAAGPAVPVAAVHAVPPADPLGPDEALPPSHPRGEDGLHELPQPPRDPDRQADRRQLRQREVPGVPRREARALPVGAPAGARELPQLPRPARHVTRADAARPQTPAVPALPLERPAPWDAVRAEPPGPGQRAERLLGRQPAPLPQLHERPGDGPRQQAPFRQVVPPMSRHLSLTGALVLATSIAAGAGPQEPPDPAPAPSPAPSPTPPAQPWRLHSNRRIDARVRPNVGLRPPALAPLYSPETPDFTGDVLSAPLFSIKTSLTTLGIWNRSTSLFGVKGNAVSSKLEEFRDLKDGVNAGLEAHARKEDAYLDVFGRHLGLADQDLTVEGGRAGVVALKLSWDETPHDYAFGARSLYGGAVPASLTISDRIQAGPPNPPSPPDAVRKLADYVAGSGQDVDLGLQRKKAGGEVTVLSLYPVTVRAQASNESRKGVRPFSESFGFANFV